MQCQKRLQVHAWLCLFSLPGKNLWSCASPWSCGIGCCSAMLAQWELPCPSHWIFSWPSWRTATSGDAPRLATLQIGKFNIGGSIMATRRRRLQLQTWLRKWRLFWFCLGLSLASWISLWVVIDICNNAHKLENVMHCQVKAYMVMECQKLAMA